MKRMIIYVDLEKELTPEQEDQMFEFFCGFYEHTSVGFSYEDVDPEESE